MPGEQNSKYSASASMREEIAGIIEWARSAKPAGFEDSFDDHVDRAMHHFEIRMRGLAESIKLSLFSENEDTKKLIDERYDSFMFGPEDPK